MAKYDPLHRYLADAGEPPWVWWVRADCLAVALEEEAAADGPPHGVRGGLTARARTRLRPSRAGL